MQKLNVFFSPTAERRPNFTLTPRHAAWLVVAAALLLLLGWAYWPTVAQVVAAWGSNPDYSHGYFVLPLAAWFLWDRRDEFPTAGVQPAWTGLLLIALAAVIRLVGARIFLPRVDAWSIPLWIGGVCWLLGGWKVFRWAAPSLAFFWFMVPLPRTIEVFLGLPLQRIATALSTSTLQCLGQPAVSEGTTILLGQQVLEVERACNGLRICYGIAALAVAYAMFFRTKRWTTLALLAGVVPVALVANACRVTATAFMLQYASHELTRLVLHDFAAVFVIPLGVAMFAGIVWLVQRLERHIQADQARTMEMSSRCYLALLAIVLPAIYWWHGFQQGRAVTGFLDRATVLEREENWADAARYLDRYLRVRPDDADVLVRLAWTFDKCSSGAAEKERALRLFADAWKAAPQQTDLGHRQAELALELRRFDQALQTAKRLSYPSDSASSRNRQDLAVARRVKALAMVGLLTSGAGLTNQITWEDTSDVLQEAIGVNPSDVALHVHLADIYRNYLEEPEEAERQQLADAVVDQLINVNPQLPEAWLARYRYRKRYHFPETGKGSLASEMDADLDRALELSQHSPKWESVEVFLVAGERAKEQENEAEARHYYQRAIEVAPADYRGYLRLGRLEAEAGGAEALQRAVSIWQDALQQIGRPEINIDLSLSTAFFVLGRDKAAEEQLEPWDQRLEYLPEPVRSSVELQIALVRANAQAPARQMCDAVTRLKRVVTSQASRSSDPMLRSLQARGWLKLGDYYFRAGTYDQAVAAYQRAGELDPAAARWRLKAGQACQAAGRITTAISHYERSVQHEPARPQIWLALAQAHLQKELRRPRQERDWEPFRTATQKAVQLNADASSLALLSADYAMAAGGDEGPEKAVAALKRALQKQPDSAILWGAMVRAHHRLDELDAALQAVDEFERCSENLLEARKLRAEILARSGKIDQAKQALQEGLDGLTPDQQIEARSMVAQIELQSGKRQMARQRLQTLAAEQPDNLEIVRDLARLAWEERDWARLEMHENQLRRAEGEDGTHWRLYRARRLLEQFSDVLDPRFREAVRLQREIANMRPGWHQTHELRGRIALREGRQPEAILAYEQSIRFGNDSPQLVEALVGLLTEQGRFEEAETYLNRYCDSVNRSTRLTSLAIPIYVQRGELKRALSLAEEWVRREPENAMHHVRLGRTFLLTSEPQAGNDSPAIVRAEQSFRQAVALAPSDVRTWVALFGYYAKLRQDRQSALAILESLSERPEIPSGAKSFVLAQLYELLGYQQQAAELYREAVRKSGTVELPRVLERAAQFFSLTDVTLAEQYCRRAIEIDPAASRSLFTLIGLLAARGGQEDLRQAFVLLEKSRVGAEPSAAKRRVEALLRIRRGEPEDCQHAIEILEDLVEIPQLASVEDRMRLARLLEQDGRNLRAYEQFQAVAAGADVAAVHLLAYVGFLHRHCEEYPEFLGQKERLLRRLETDPQTALTALQVRLKILRETTSGDRREDQAIRKMVNDYIKAHCIDA